MLRGKFPVVGFMKKHGRKNAGRLASNFLIFAPLLSVLPLLFVVCFGGFNSQCVLLLRNLFGFGCEVFVVAKLHSVIEKVFGAGLTEQFLQQHI